MAEIHTEYTADTATVTDEKGNSRMLMVALFATGLSGIVAEYILATLATYFLGNAVLQWTMILSCMLFSMGLGSRISKYFDKHILELFMGIEFILSLLVSTCAIAVYGFMAYTENIGLLIYGFAIAIGLLIGMEIPLVTRINGRYKNLKANISSVMEKDYYGSLIGGLFFAFVGMPYLGLTYTPFVLGAVNFLVAIILFITQRKLAQKRLRTFLLLGAGVIMSVIALGLIKAEPIILHAEQSRFLEKVVYSKQTQYQRITVTQFQEDYWLRLNYSKQLSTFDEFLYHEPLVHPVMTLSKHPADVLILGAGDGCAIREALKYDQVRSVTLVDLDPEMTSIGANHPIFTELNDSAYHDPKVKVINVDAFNYLLDNKLYFDVIICDFPDPKSIELNRLYTKEFYGLVHKRLRPKGLMITQAVSPYYHPHAFHGIENTVRAAGFATQPLRNNVYTFGEWGWVVGAKDITQDQLKPALQQLEFEVPVEWISNEAMQLITSFGADIKTVDSVEVNTIHNPVLYQHYLRDNDNAY